LLNNCTNGTALQDIHKTLNLIRNQIDAVDAETKLAVFELMLGTSTSLVALAKKMAKPETKTLTRTVSIPKTKAIKQPIQQSSNTTSNKPERTAAKTITPQKPLSSEKFSQ
jgi:hypothetical protein